MIWFKIKELEDKLGKNEIPDKASYHYILAFTILYSLVLNGENVDYYTNKWWRILNFVIGLSISIYGIRKSYYINEGGDNKDFLKRLFSLAFVHGFRILMFVLPVFLIFNIINEITIATIDVSLISFIPENPGSILLDTLLSGVFYLLIIRSFKKINEKKEVFKGDIRRKIQNFTPAV